MNVIIGIDPHKATHTAVAIGCDEGELATITVRATTPADRPVGRVGRPVREADLGHRVRWRPRVSAGPAAGGCRRGRARRAGHLGLGCGCWGRGSRTRTIPTTPGRWPSPHCGHRGCVGAGGQSCRGTAPVGQAQQRHRKPAHQAGVPAPRPIASLSAGGIAKELNASDADGLLASIRASLGHRTIRHQLALELLEDVRRLDGQLKESQQRIKRRSGPRGPPSPSLSGSVPSSPVRSSATPAMSPLRQPGPVRRLQRHRSGRGLLGRPGDPPPLPPRESTAQSRHPHGGHLPDPPDPTPRAGSTSSGRWPRARPKRTPSAR